MSEKVNYSWKLNPTYRKINTSEFCFFCLKPTKIKTEITELDGFCNKNESKESTEHPSISLLCLRRHLKINVNDIIVNSTSERASFVSDEAEVNSCKVCERTVCKFSVSFQQLEKIEMEMDYYLEEIRFSIQKGIENPKLVEAYSKGMTSKADTLSQLAWIDKLRKEISENCSNVRAASHPTVEIERNAIPPHVKEEIFSDIKEGVSKEELSPPGSPPPSPSDSNAISSAQMAIEMNKSTKRFHCPSCNQSFTTKHVAQTHFNVIHLQEKWKCELCHMEMRAYPAHIRTHKSKCRQRLQNLSEDAKAREHFKFPCAICNKRFPSRNGLGKHKRRVHGTSRPFRCTLCKKGFKCADELRKHSKSVHMRIKWKCKYCTNQFSYPESRTKHERTCLKKSNIKVDTDAPAKLKFSLDLTGRAQCPSCDKTFPEPGHARRHYNDIHLKERMKCDLCLATFVGSHFKNMSEQYSAARKVFIFMLDDANQTSLIQHKKIHFSNSVFPCDLCEKRYKSQRGLNYHKDSVHFNKTISCEHCKKRFKPSWISVHIKRCKQRNLGVKLESNNQETEDSVTTTQLNRE